MMRNLLEATHPLLWPYAGFLYLFGSLLSDSPITPTLIAYGIWFTIFGSSLGFLINNYFDRALDAHNPRKKPLALSSAGFAWGIGLCVVALAATQAFFPSLPALLCAGIAIAVNLLYSAPLTRLKESPGLDLLVGPGSFLSILCAGYLLRDGGLSPVLLLAGVAFFSALELAHKSLDIEADIRGGIRTSATALGRSGALATSIGLLATAGILAGTATPLYGFSVLPYIGIVSSMFSARTDTAISQLNKRLPMYYSVAGFVVTSLWLLIG